MQKYIPEVKQNKELQQHREKNNEIRCRTWQKNVQTAGEGRKYSIWKKGNAAGKGEIKTE